MARRSTGLQFAIHFRGSDTDHADPHKNAPNDTFSSRLLQRHFATKMFLRADLHDWFYAARNFAMVDDYSYPAVPRWAYFTLQSATKVFLPTDPQRGPSVLAARLAVVKKVVRTIHAYTSYCGGKQSCLCPCGLDADETPR
jgi:hypothetical protein